jgi:CDP-diacylglycerol--glycerol-3-phosphate 3-phosphatidyltransferase
MRSSVVLCSNAEFRANLSNDYFTNRQDRYHVFSSKEITQYFSEIHNTVSRLSFLVTPSQQDPAGYTLDWPTQNLAPSPLSEPSKYTTLSTSILNHIILPSATPHARPPKKNTTIYLLSQFTQLLHPDTSTELPLITSLLTTLSSPIHNTSSWTFTAGYFNPAPTLQTLLLNSSSKNNIIITASPEANGFYNSPGISGLLPAAYTLLSRRFLERAHATKSPPSIALKEYRRGVLDTPSRWTYHAKGLWISLNAETSPSISIVGSSNYTKRSYGLDLEVGACIVTSDEGLKRRLREERDGLQVFAREVGLDEFVKTERRVGWQVRVAMWIVKMVGGAL